MAKGNRSSSKRNTSSIQEFNKAYKEEIKGYKEFAEARRKNRVYTQEQVTEYYNDIVEYMKRKDEAETPYTISGLQLAMNLNDMAFQRMKDGEYDYRLYEYMDTMDISEADILVDKEKLPYVMVDGKKVLLIPYSSLIQKAYLKIQEQIETRLYEKGRVGDIFALKSKYGWTDSESTPQTVNQTLVIATEEQAREAIRLLG